jgi:hypothetical protein
MMLNIEKNGYLLQLTSYMVAQRRKMLLIKIMFKNNNGRQKINRINVTLLECVIFPFLLI